VRTALKERARRVVQPVARGLVRLGVSPNGLTLFAFLASVGAGVLFGLGAFAWGALVLLVAGLGDMLDGAVAREGGTTTTFGAFFDSTMDRYAELAVFGGYLAYFVREGSLLYALLSFLAAGGSFGVSYARARAEGLGVDCRVGLMERPERMVLLLVASAVGPAGVRVALWILTALVYWTGWQRIRHVLGATRP